MTNKLPLPPPGFDDLPVEDQINYVQSLWDRIAAKPDQVPIPQWHRQVLDERLAAHEANPEVARPWEAVRDEIRSKLGRRLER
ncbi:MAG: addiction module protein [Acidobacteria bacterium]|nr:addiction module protein [Acidobacteriota bacterium]